MMFMKSWRKIYFSRALRQADPYEHRRSTNFDNLKTWRLPYLILASGVFTFGALTASCHKNTDMATGVEVETNQVVSNWSATHTCEPKIVYEPKSAQEVLRLLQSLHSQDKKARPIGTALSPNGIGMSDDTLSLISLHAIDYIEVDVKNQVVTVGAGARVHDVLKELEKHGMTLQNFSSIQEQQMVRSLNCI